MFKDKLDTQEYTKRICEIMYSFLKYTNGVSDELEIARQCELSNEELILASSMYYIPDIKFMIRNKESYSSDKFIFKSSNRMSECWMSENLFFEDGFDRFFIEKYNV